MYLPDVNFWLALAFDSQAHHVLAKSWMQSAALHSVCFCRVTQLGFLRLATNRKAFPVDAVSMRESWQLYEDLFNDDRTAFSDEPDHLEATLKVFTQLRTFSTNVWTDAYLAAFAKTGNFELVTFDKGFVQYEGLRATILS